MRANLPFGMISGVVMVLSSTNNPPTTNHNKVEGFFNENAKMVTGTFPKLTTCCL